MACWIRRRNREAREIEFGLLALVSTTTLNPRLLNSFSALPVHLCLERASGRQRGALDSLRRICTAGKVMPGRSSISKGPTSLEPHRGIKTAQRYSVELAIAARPTPASRGCLEDRASRTARPTPRRVCVRVGDHVTDIGVAALSAPARPAARAQRMPSASVSATIIGAGLQKRGLRA